MEKSLVFTHISPIIIFIFGEIIYFRVDFSTHRVNKDEIPGAQVDLLIDRKDGMINLCEAKFSNKEFIITKEYAAKLRQKRAVFEQVTKTKKATVTTLLSTYPAIQNKYYEDEIHSEVCMDDLFEEVI